MLRTSTSHEEGCDRHFSILTKEFRVAALQGEEREPYVTRDVWEAERVLSELRGFKLTQMTHLNLDEPY